MSSLLNMILNGGSGDPEPKKKPANKTGAAANKAIAEVVPSGQRVTQGNEADMKSGMDESTKSIYGFKQDLRNQDDQDYISMVNSLQDIVGSGRTPNLKTDTKDTDAH